MKRDEIPNLGKIVDETVEGVLYDCNENGDVTSLSINFKKKRLIIISATDTFNMVLLESE